MARQGEHNLDVGETIKHIKSLGGSATADEIGGPKAVSRLLNLELIELAFIGSYRLTEKGNDYND